MMVRAVLPSICGTAGADGRAVKGTGGGHVEARAGGAGSNRRAHTRQAGRSRGGWVWRTLKYPPTDASTGPLRL
eukprot:scaffold30705_cov79-Isochrysis_galbana.AAC.1